MVISESQAPAAFALPTATFSHALFQHATPAFTAVLRAQARAGWHTATAASLTNRQRMSSAPTTAAATMESNDVDLKSRGAALAQERYKQRLASRKNRLESDDDPRKKGGLAAVRGGRHSQQGAAQIAAGYGSL